MTPAKLPPDPLGGAAELAHDPLESHHRQFAGQGHLLPDPSSLLILTTGHHLSPGGVSQADHHYDGDVEVDGDPHPC